MSELAGKVALVTGGSRGIGAAIARRLARDGAAVAFTYVTAADQALAIAKQIDADGSRVLVIQADSADPGAVVAAVEQTVQELGRLDILVYNAIGATNMTTTTKLSELSGDYVFDTAHTRIGFVARHTMATKVRGQFDEFEGITHLDGDDPSKSSAELTIQAKSIQTRNQQRDQALRSKFLDMDDQPAITFTSTGVEQVDETNFKVTGDLTIRGVTKPVTVDFELTGAENDPWGNFRVGFEGSVTINRKDWGVNWNAATGVLVSEKVTLEFDVAAIRQS